MKTVSLWAALLFFACATPSALAKEAHGTTLDLTVSVSKPVMQDTLDAALYYRAEGKTAAEVQETINRAMQDVWAKASANPAIKARLTGYRVWYEENRRPAREPGAADIVTGKWVGNQSLSMESHDFKALKQLVGAFQHDGLIVNHIGFSVSPALREQTQEALMPSAAEKLRHKAKLLADSFGVKVLRFDQVSLNGAGGGPVWRETQLNAFAAPRSSGGVVAPVAEPVEENISLTLGGRAMLSTVEGD
ncbi:SIMPL domain-containing protein [Kordiimonas marina]|uniref:SIMPL domain-containing protein n=1 Tax=Kordiimonas marina TaxID=2872312 RepID=UPI001FF620B2|nr:SIMPL domain-containing protein [Kordiimonas marina]MCJ9428992.1 SIMPL domain-containing protein [Kordiimonas marina]